MLSSYNLIIDVVSKDKTIGEMQFREQVDLNLNVLNELRGAIGRGSGSIVYFAPNESPLNPDFGFWSARGVVLISVGKERGDNLLLLYHSLVDLIAFALPEFEIRAETAVLSFS